MEGPWFNISATDGGLARSDDVSATVASWTAVSAVCVIAGNHR
jgi:hypothetical protein